MQARRGFTLVELLVVMLIIGILVAVLIPAVNSARESARATHSKNNVRQIALAANSFNSATGYYPPSWSQPASPLGENYDGWSIFALLLPYLDQKVTATEIDYTISYNVYVNANPANPYDAQTNPWIQTADGVKTRLGTLRVPVYLSPGEPRDEARNGQHYPLNYAVNLGTGFVFDPATGNGGNGIAYPNSKIRDSGVSDGLSSTLGFAEVKAWRPYIRNNNLSTGDLTTIMDANGITPAAFSALVAASGEFKVDSGHTEWIDGRGHHSGFTTVFRPNTKVAATGSLSGMASGVTYDIDWTNWQEGKGLAKTTPDLNQTYVASTARGYFGKVVHVSMADATVKSIEDGIDYRVWRALSTRAGAEKLPNSALR